MLNNLTLSGILSASSLRTANLWFVSTQLALAPYKHLPQEIESLKAVMEMRNQEIRDLRLQKLELEKQV